MLCWWHQASTSPSSSNLPSIHAINHHVQSISIPFVLLFYVPVSTKQVRILVVSLPVMLDLDKSCMVIELAVRVSVYFIEWDAMLTKRAIGAYNDPILCAICGVDYYNLFKDNCKTSYAVSLLHIDWDDADRATVCLWVRIISPFSNILLNDHGQWKDWYSLIYMSL